MARKAMGTGVQKRLILVWLFLGMSSFAFGQQRGGKDWAVDTVVSRTLGKRSIFISTPEGYGEEGLRYPILVMLDSEDHRMFRLWIAQAEYLAGNSPGFPAVIAVGIPNGRDRIHDMTPPASGSVVKDFPNAGGASAFADFIIDEVLTNVRARYRTLPGTFLIGHSAGGLFALDVAAHRPTAFQGVVATSPAIWFNDGTLIEAYVDLMSRSHSHPRIFVANESGEGGLAVACRRFAELLNATKSLAGTFKYQAYNLTHQMTPMSIGEGLQFVFDPVSLSHLAIEHLDFEKVDSVALHRALLSSESVYVNAARTLGLSSRLPEPVLNRLGYRLLGNKNVSLAIQVFEQNVRNYPSSWNVYDSLGEGYAVKGDTAMALENYEKSIQLNPHNSNGIEYLKKLRGR